MVGTLTATFQGSFDATQINIAVAAQTASVTKQPNAKMMISLMTCPRCR